MRFNGILLLLILVFPFGILLATEATDPVILNYAAPKDSVLNKITDIDKRLKEFTRKDTTKGFSSPRMIETSSFFKVRRQVDDANRNKKGLITVPLNYEPFLSFVNFLDTVIVHPVLLPVVFDGRILPNDMDFRTRTHEAKSMRKLYLLDEDSIVAPDLVKYKALKNNSRLISSDSTFLPALKKTQGVMDTRRIYYVSNPERIKSNALAFGSSPIEKTEIENKNPFKELITAGDAVKIAAPDISRYNLKQKFWTKHGEHALQVSQKSYTSNWSPKTNNSLYIQNYHKFTTRYQKNKIQFEHLLEWRLNASHVSVSNEEKEKSPDYSSWVINDDWVRSYNKLGLDAFVKRWSYIVTGEAKTPIFQKVAQLDKKKFLGAIFSPLELNFGIGMGYTLERKSTSVRDRKFKLTVDGTPLSVNYKLVRNDRVLANNRFGIPADEGRSKAEFGSTLNSKVDYSFNGFSSISSRLKYFTNYERTYVESENTVNFQLNRYLSSSLYFYLKFDDAQKTSSQDKTWKYFSYNEVIGFGLTYKW